MWTNSLKMLGLQSYRKKHKIDTLSHACILLKKQMEISINAVLCSGSTVREILGKGRLFLKGERNFSKSRTILCLTPVQNADELTNSLTNVMGQSELQPKHFPSSS